MRFTKAWINQPSSAMPLSNLHGINVMYRKDENTVYFLSGPVLSMRLNTPGGLVLSRGWIKGGHIPVSPEQNAKQGIKFTGPVGVRP